MESCHPLTGKRDQRDAPRLDLATLGLCAALNEAASPLVVAGCRIDAPIRLSGRSTL